MPQSRSLTEPPDEDPGGLGQSRTLKGRLRRGFGKTDSDGASWSKVHIAGGDADFALDPAPAGADPEGAQRGTVGEGEAERGLLPGRTTTPGSPLVSRRPCRRIPSSPAASQRSTSPRCPSTPTGLS